MTTARAAATALVVAAALAVGACGDDGTDTTTDVGSSPAGIDDDGAPDIDGAPDTDGTTTSSAGDTIDDGGEPTPVPDDVRADRLVFLDVTADELAPVLATYGATIEQEVPEIGAIEVRFPVDSFDDLLAIRAELQADGFNVDVSVETDPTLGGPAAGG